MASNPTPENRYQIAQLVGFTVNEMIKPQTDWLSHVADVKNIGYGDRASFAVQQDGLRAFIQAKGATTARSKISHRQVDLGTTSVSVRPMINFVELKTGRVQMSDLINDATVKMEQAMLHYFQNVLQNAMSTWTAPYYGAGAGLIKTTLNPMIRYWHRTGGAALLGDIEVTDKIAELTGFAAATTTQQFAPSIIEEYHRSGVIGSYLGSKVVTLINPYQDDEKTPVINPRYLYILPTGLDMTMRPLKVVFEGDVVSTEASHVDDLTYEIRLDRFFGAGVVIGKTPTFSVYEDQSI